MIDAAALRRLAAMQLDPDQMSDVLLMFADQAEAEERRKASQRERTRKSRANRDGNVTVTSETQDRNASPPSPKENPQTPKETPPTTHKENPPKGGQKKGSRLPIDFTPDFDFALNAGLSRSQAQTEFAKFRDYWAAKSGQGAIKTDWQATWRNWVRSAVERMGNQRAGPLPPKPNPALAAADALMEKFDAVSPSQTEANPPYPRLVAVAGGG